MNTAKHLAAVCLYVRNGEGSYTGFHIAIVCQIIYTVKIQLAAISLTAILGGSKPLIALLKAGTGTAGGSQIAFYRIGRTGTKTTRTVFIKQIQAIKDAGIIYLLTEIECATVVSARDSCSSTRSFTH